MLFFKLEIFKDSLMIQYRELIALESPTLDIFAIARYLYKGNIALYF